MTTRECIRNSYEVWREKQDAKGNLSASYTQWLEELSTEYTKLTISLGELVVNEANSATEYRRKYRGGDAERTYLRELVVREKEDHAHTLSRLLK